MFLKACQKHFLRNVIPCQVICNDVETDPIPNELKDLKCLEKIDVGKDSVSKKTKKQNKNNRACERKKLKVLYVMCQLNRSTYAAASF